MNITEAVDVTVAKLIAMVLLWETTEDVTSRNRGHKGGVRHEEDQKKKAKEVRSDPSKQI